MNEYLKKILIGLIVAVSGGGLLILFANLSSGSKYQTLFDVFAGISLLAIIVGVIIILVNCIAPFVYKHMDRKEEKTNSQIRSANSELARKVSPFFTYEEALSHIWIGDRKFIKKMSFISSVSYCSNSSYSNLLQLNRCFFTVDSIIVVGRVFLYDVYTYEKIEDDGIVFTKIKEISINYSAYDKVRMLNSSIVTKDKDVIGIYFNDELYLCLNTFNDTEFSTASELLAACKCFVK